MKIAKISIFSAVVVAALTACGGGGGSGGESHEPYSIKLRAEKTQLPLNISNYPVGQGVYAPFSTTLYVEAKEGSRPIPGGEEIFACNMAGGLDSGSLYYLDGNPEHEEEVDDGNGGKVKVPLAYRSITLGSNSGGNSFHFHAKNQAGTARITCTVTDPRDKKVHSGSVDIVVGGTTGKPASVSMVVPSQRSYMGTQRNADPRNLPSDLPMQAFVQDDAIQPVSSSSGANVQVRILPGTDAAVGARLVAGSLSGGVLQLPSIGGVAQFSLLSGTETGPIFLEFTADRHDNNVGNGIQDPISIIDVVSVLEALTDPLQVADEDLGDVTNTVPYTRLLTATGGLPPLSWSATGLPKGLAVDSKTGLLSGTPDDAEGVYRATVTVRDKNKLVDTATITLNLVGAVKPEDFAISNCNVNAGVNDACALTAALAGQRYAYAFTASVPGVTWAVTGAPSWIVATSAGTAGVITGTPAACTPATPPATAPVPSADVDTHRFFVTATKGVTSVTRQVSITVTCP